MMPLIPSMPLPSMPAPGVGGIPTLGLPVGTVVAFAGQIASSPYSPEAHFSNVEAQGWMICDGRQLETGTYPELFAALGYWYGGEGKRFTLPDYRGYFLRGVGETSEHDPDMGDRTPPPGQGATTSDVGSTQQDALQVHQHTYQENKGTGIGGDKGAAVATIPTSQFTGTPTDKAKSSKIKVSQHETRPKNIYVHYIIKYTYSV